MSISNILAAVDLSGPSHVAVSVAANLARRHAALLTLLHVDRVPAFGERLVARASADVAEAYLADRADSVRRILEDLASSLGGVHTKIAVARGEPAPMVVERAAHDGSDLVVLGAHGGGNGGHAWIGSVAWEVAARSTRPVLVARHRRPAPDAKGFHRPLVAVGLDRPLDAAIALAGALCTPDALFDFVHVHETPSVHGKPPIPEAASEALAHARARRAERLEAEVKKLRAGPLSLHFDEAESVSEAIFARIERDGHDLVVIGQRAAATPSGTLGPVARRLLEHARASIAIVPA